MRHQDTTTDTPVSTDISTLITRLTALDRELVAHRRMLICAIDDFGVTLEQSRQVRQQIIGLLTPDGAR